MTSESYDASPHDIQRIHAQRRQAAQAMVRLIVLRGEQAPNLEADSHEGWLRNQVFRLQHEALQLDPEGVHDTEPRYLTLAETMVHPRLEELAQPGRPLTRERLIQVDPTLLAVADRVDAEGIGWPTEDAVFHDVLPEDFDDFAFGRRLAEGGRAYNNFPALLSAIPSVPSEGEDIVSFMQRTKWYQYATKPYLVRAHMVEPEFMGALQRRMTEVGSAKDWQENLFRAVTEEHPDPEDQILLRASRLAYQLLINLMRADDLHVQAELLSMHTKQDITDAITELWT